MKHLFIPVFLFVVACGLSVGGDLYAQELSAKVVVNTSQISNTKKDVFDALQEKVQNFLNDRQWTEMREPKETEKITCNFNITITKWDESTSAMEGQLLLTTTRPVYGTSYSTNLYSLKDEQFNFSFQTTDQLEWNTEYVDNNLTAMLAYYAYMIIGYDLDSMSPQGGTDYLRLAENVVTNSQSLGYTGWSQLNEPKNRAGLLNDYLDAQMESYRQLIYKYHRQGLDQMATSADSGRQAITEALELLDECKNARTMSQLPTLFTETKKDELVNIFQGKDTREVRARVYDILFGVNPSLSDYWDKIKN